MSIVVFGFDKYVRERPMQIGLGGNIGAGGTARDQVLSGKARVTVRGRRKSAERADRRGCVGVVKSGGGGGAEFGRGTQ